MELILAYYIGELQTNEKLSETKNYLKRKN
jgi:hypothetical protein